MLSGMCGEEGNDLVVYDLLLALNKTVDEGLSLETVRDYLVLRCESTITKYSARLCSHFVIKTYGLDEEGIDDKERVRRLRDFLSKHCHRNDSMADLTAYICNKSRSELAFDFVYTCRSFHTRNNVPSPYYVAVKMNCSPKTDNKQQDITKL